MGWVRWLYLTETEWKLWIFAANLLKYFPHPFICRCPGWVTGLVSTIHVMYVQGELSGVRGGGGSSLCHQANNLRDATLQLNISIASCLIHLQEGGNVEGWYLVLFWLLHHIGSCRVQYKHISPHVHGGKLLWRHYACCVRVGGMWEPLWCRSDGPHNATQYHGMCSE